MISAKELFTEFMSQECALTDDDWMAYYEQLIEEVERRGEDVIASDSE